MTIWSHARTAGSPQRRLALWALCGALPLLTLAYQICAKQAAKGLAATPFGAEWIGALVRNPWAQALFGFEIVSFVAWMVVLAEMKLSAAFSLSALSYILVILASWIVFREPADLMQVLGGAAILGGVWMIGSDDLPKAGAA
jgi:multidrug transporter EmrE-like cation transporter